MFKKKTTTRATLLKIDNSHSSPSPKCSIFPQIQAETSLFAPMQFPCTAGMNKACEVYDKAYPLCPVTYH